MLELIDIGTNQGSILGFPEGTKENEEFFKSIVELVQLGRLGDSKRKGVSSGCLFVVLTQDCSIANTSKYIELAQLKKLKEQDEERVNGLLLGKNYSKLYIKIKDDYYQAEEILITKIAKQKLLDIVKKESFILQSKLPNRSIKIILDWRILSYKREPFPDKFNRLLSEYLKNTKSWFTEFLLEHQHDIHSIRLYVTPEDAEDAEQYQFSLCALLTESGVTKQDEIETNVFKMLEQFNEYDDVDCLQIIDLAVDSINIPEHLVLAASSTLDEFTFSNAYVMREFNFQYLCY